MLDLAKYSRFLILSFPQKLKSINLGSGTNAIHYQ